MFVSFSNQLEKVALHFIGRGRPDFNEVSIRIVEPGFPGFLVGDSVTFFRHKFGFRLDVAHKNVLFLMQWFQVTLEHFHCGFLLGFDVRNLD